MRPRFRAWSSLGVFLALTASISCAGEAQVGDFDKAISTPTPYVRPGLVSARVTRVVDGDTIHVEIAGKDYRLRYIGIDTPETVDPRRPVGCFGKEASERNRLLVEGKMVGLEKDISETDAFGRLLRYVWVEDVMVNSALVEEGYALAVTYPPDVRYSELFASLQAQAREGDRGLWGAACGGAAVPHRERGQSAFLQASHAFRYNALVYPPAGTASVGLGVELPLNPFNAVLGIFSHDIAIDLGTANTLVMVKGRGIVIDEPSVVAIDRINKKILAIGVEAKRMVGRTPADIVAVRPLRDGVISDFSVTEKMLHYFIRSVHDHFGFGLPRPRVSVGIPSGVTEVEKRAVHDAALNAGARNAYLVEEPMAAAIGAGLPVMEPGGSMIVDIGGGTTEVAVISMGGIVVATSIRTAGDEMDAEIVSYARQVHNMLIGERTAEEVKIEAGSGYPLEREITIELKGRDLATGLPKAVEVSSVEIRDALSSSVNAIVESVRQTIEITPPELVADIMSTGIILAGGGALLRGLDRRLAQETRFPVYVAEEPLTCVVRGAAEVLEEAAILQKLQARLNTRKAPR